MTLIIFLVIFLYFGLQAPRFLGLDSIANIVKQASFIGIIAVGMTFVLLTAGIDLSVGSNMYLSAMSAGYLMQNPAFQNGWGVAARDPRWAACTGTLFGAVNAFCIVVLRITPFLVTLATLVAGRGLGTAITESFGIEFPAPYLAFGASNLFGIPMPIVAFAIVVLVAHIVLSRTQFGRQIYAVGNDPDAARKAGIAVDRIVFSGLRHLRLLRGSRRRHADRADRPAQPDLRRRQGVRRHHRGGARRHQPVRRRRPGVRGRGRLDAGADGAVGHDLHRRQPLPAADGARWRSSSLRS